MTLRSDSLLYFSPVSYYFYYTPPDHNVYIWIDKPKPVGFATHITAGGIAGAMEAVSQNDLAFRASLTLSSFSYVVSQPPDHHQGSSRDATLQVGRRLPGVSYTKPWYAFVVKFAF